jgi:hypothetical protein
VTPRICATPAAYKFALESQIAVEAKKRPLPINRVRQLLVAERMLAHVMQHFGDRVIAKGGLVFEIRLARAHYQGCRHPTHGQRGRPARRASSGVRFGDGGLP